MTPKQERDPNRSRLTFTVRKPELIQIGEVQLYLRKNPRGDGYRISIDAPRTTKITHTTSPDVSDHLENRGWK